MFSYLHVHEREIFFGNILFVVCCAFYLAWWMVSFRPEANGGRTGWLLIPASIAGILGVILILRGILAGTMSRQLLNGRYIIWGGIALYLILLAITVMLMKRPPTTELILIVGWAMLVLAEINALFGYELFSRNQSIGFMVPLCLFFAVSFVCYILFYRLSIRAGYIAGMIPLLLVAFAMAGISCFMVIGAKR